MEEKKEKKRSLKKALKYGGFAAAAIGVGYLAGNKTAREKVMGQVKNFGARFKKEEAPCSECGECSTQEESRFNNDFNRGEYRRNGQDGRRYQDRREFRKTEGGSHE